MPSQTAHTACSANMSTEQSSCPHPPPPSLEITNIGSFPITVQTQGRRRLPGLRRTVTVDENDFGQGSDHAIIQVTSYIYHVILWDLETHDLYIFRHIHRSNIIIRYNQTEDFNEIFVCFEGSVYTQFDDEGIVQLNDFELLSSHEPPQIADFENWFNELEDPLECPHFHGPGTESCYSDENPAGPEHICGCETTTLWPYLRENLEPELHTLDTINN